MPYKPTMLPPAIALAAEQMRPADYIKWFADVMPKSTAERFWDKVDASGECWLWVGNLYPNGYGYLGYPAFHVVSHSVHCPKIP